MYVDYNVSVDGGPMALTIPEDIFDQSFEMNMIMSQGHNQYYPNEGIQLEDFLWDTNYKNSDIANHLTNQLNLYSRMEGVQYSVDDIKLVEMPDGDDACFIEYTVGDKSSIIEVVQ